MNRNIEIERALELRNFGTAEKDAFRMGAHWADTHPIYPDGIPARGPKSPGELLALVSVLRQWSCNNESINKFYLRVKENVERGYEPFWGVDFVVRDPVDEREG